MKRIFLSILLILCLGGYAHAGPWISAGGGGSSMTYPGAGIPKSTGSAWDTSISASANVYTLLGSADFAAMRSNLSLVPGTDIQAFNTYLAAIAGLTAGADGVPIIWSSGVPSNGSGALKSWPAGASKIIWNDGSNNPTTTGYSIGAHVFYAGPTTGDPAEPTWRYMVATDLPTMESSDLAGIIPDETGIGSLVFAQEPSLVGPMLKNSATSGGYFDMYEDSDNGSNYIRVQAPSSISSSVTVYMPAVTTGDTLAYGSAALRFNTGGSTVREKTVSDAAATIVEIDQTAVVRYEYLKIADAVNGASAPAAAAVVSDHALTGRAFDASTQEDVFYDWRVPTDWSSGFKYRVYYVLDADASADNTVIFGLAGCSMGNSDDSACTVGDAVTVTDELGTDDDQYEYMVSDWSGAVTITNLAAGEKARLNFYRDADAAGDDYGSDVHVVGIEIKYLVKFQGSSAY